MKKILANTVYSNTTLKRMKKDDLIKQIRILEHNWQSTLTALDNSAKECKRIHNEYERDKQELLKFVSGEFVESSIVQRLFGISFGECMTRFVFARTAEWNKAPLNGQNITNYFRIPVVEKGGDK